MLVYRGERGTDLDWDSIESATEVSVDEWKDYKEKPFTSHTEYVKQLKRLSEKYVSDMSRTDKKNNSMLEVLRAGSSYSHYMYLFNNSIFQKMSQCQGIQNGTMVNEAEHRILKRWTECVYQQHKDRVELVREVYALYRMLGNSYKNVHKAAAHNYQESESISMLSGLIARGYLERDVVQDVASVPAASSRLALKRPVRTVPELVREDQARRLCMRVESTGTQRSLDLKAMKVAPKRRITKKSSTADVGVKRVHSRRPCRQKNSVAIANAVDIAIKNESG